MGHRRQKWGDKNINDSRTSCWRNSFSAATVFIGGIMSLRDIKGWRPLPLKKAVDLLTTQYTVMTMDSGVQAVKVIDHDQIYESRLTNDIIQDWDSPLRKMLLHSLKDDIVCMTSWPALQVHHAAEYFKICSALWCHACRSFLNCQEIC